MRELLNQYTYISFQTILLYYIQYLIPTNWGPIYSCHPRRLLIFGCLWPFDIKSARRPAMILLWYVCHCWSLPVTLSVMRNDTFYTTTIVRKKRGNALPGMRKTYFRLWRHIRSGPLPVRSLPAAHAHAMTSGSSTTTNMPWAVPIYYYYWGPIYSCHPRRLLIFGCLWPFDIKSARRPAMILLW
jgi:hypothetical protein